MSTQNETAAFILAELPGSRIVKRPKKNGTTSEGLVRWVGRIADEHGDLHTVEVIDSEPRTLSTTPYVGFGKE
jgi:hypothetical protein